MDQLLALFRDPQWQFWGVVVGLLSIAVAFIVWWLSREHKELSYTVLSEAAIVNPADDVGGRLQVLFDGEDVKNLTAVVLSLTNTGNTPILRTDFDEPLTIRFADGAKILDATGIGSPDTLVAKVDHTVDVATLQPLLLNSNDTISLAFLVDNHVRGKVRIGGRIVGISQTKHVDADRAAAAWRNNRTFPVVFAVNLVACLAFAVFLVAAALSGDASWDARLAWAMWVLVPSELLLLYFMARTGQ